MEPILSNLRTVCNHNLRTVCNHSCMFGRRQQKRNEESYPKLIIQLQNEISDMNEKLKKNLIELHIVKMKVSDLQQIKKSLYQQVMEWEKKYQKIQQELIKEISKRVNLEYDEKKIQCKCFKWQTKSIKKKQRIEKEDNGLKKYESRDKASSQKATFWQGKCSEIKIQLNLTIQKLTQQITKLQNNIVPTLQLTIKEQNTKLIQSQRNCSEINNQLILANERVKEYESRDKASSQKATFWQGKCSEIKIQLNLTIQKLTQQITKLQNNIVPTLQLTIKEQNTKLIQSQRNCSEINNQLILANERVKEYESRDKASSQKATFWQGKCSEIKIQLNLTIQKLTQQISKLENKICQLENYIQNLLKQKGDLQIRLKNIDFSKQTEFELIYQQLLVKYNNLESQFESQKMQLNQKKQKIQKLNKQMQQNEKKIELFMKNESIAKTKITQHQIFNNKQKLQYKKVTNLYNEKVQELQTIQRKVNELLHNHSKSKTESLQIICGLFKKVEKIAWENLIQQLFNAVVNNKQ